MSWLTRTRLRAALRLSRCLMWRLGAPRAYGEAALRDSFARLEKRLGDGLAGLLKAQRIDQAGCLMPRGLRRGAWNEWLDGRNGASRAQLRLLARWLATRLAGRPG